MGKQLSLAPNSKTVWYDVLYTCINKLNEIGVLYTLDEKLFGCKSARLNGQTCCTNVAPSCVCTVGRILNESIALPNYISLL